MAILSNRKNKKGPSSGHDFDKVKEKHFGSGRGKINKRKDLFGSDYIYVYRESTSDDDDMDFDAEVGINKSYHRIHDMDWCNMEKNEHHSLNRFFDSFAEDGSYSAEDILDFLNEEGDYNE